MILKLSPIDIRDVGEPKKYLFSYNSAQNRIKKNRKIERKIDTLNLKNFGLNNFERHGTHELPQILPL